MRTFEVELRTGIAEFVLIENEDGSELTMLKSTYDAMQAEQSTPMVTDEAATL
jgi:hypothetical protein